MAINFLNSVDFNKNELLNPTIENQPNDTGAGTGVEGQLYFNTTDDILKVYAGGAWVEVGGGVTSLTTTDGTYINLTPNSATTGPVTVTADLSAVDGTAGAGERYLTKSNTWATVASIAGTTYDLTGGVSDTTNFAISLIGSDSTLDKVFLKSSTYITLTDGGSNDVTFTHANTSRSDTTSTDAPGYGGTFEAVTSVTTNATGHITAIDVSTVTIPASDNVTYTLPVNAGGGNSASIELVAGGAGSGVAGAVVIQGTADEIEITETTGSFGSITIGLPDDVTIDGELTVAGTGQSSFAGQVTIPQTPSADTDAASKHYVDQAVTGALSYQGGYNAATNTPDLTTSPNSIEKGWTYTVTADGTFFGEQLRVGDVIIAEVDDPSALADWTTVQNNIDLASLTQVGIGNVNASALDNELGIEVAYAAGTAKVGLDIDGLALDLLVEGPDDYYLPIYDEGSAINNKAKLSDLVAFANSVTSYAATITDTDTVEHGLGTQDVIVQLYDVTTGETVYADVDRTGANDVDITFATTPTNSIRVLVQKIG